MYRNMTISLVLPCRNEEAGLAKMLPRVPEYFDEVVAVDNGSSDATSNVAAAAGAKVVREDNPGYGNAYKAGFAAASCDIVVTMDADDTYPIDSVAGLLDTLVEKNLDFITVRRMHVNWERTSQLVIRFLGKKVLDFALSLTIMKMVHDSQSGMWIFRRAILEKMTLTSPGMSFSEEIKLEAFSRKGIRAAELPVKYQYRKREGKSKLNTFRDGLYNLYFIFKKRLLLILNA